ncbi:MAG: lolE 2 [Gammaproteobacteria bacterium]|jgi:lipoprotein-releasing system permease protein|nr:lolE 2 [Gammaproteobacteria bacterium]
MFRPIAVFIGLRYTRAKRRNHFISFISLMSMLGIALGILVLITVLSVMNGFDKEIQKRVFSMVPPITVGSFVNAVSNWQQVESKLHEFPSVTAVAPFVNGEVLLSNNNAVQPVLLTGILPSKEKNISELSEKIVQGSLTHLMPGQFGILLGEELANRLDVSVGDKVTAVTPRVSLSLAGVMPRLKRFTVIGIFRAGSGFGFDTSLAFIHLRDAQKLFEMSSSVTALHVKIPDAYAAPKIAEQIANRLGSTARVTSWTDQFGEYFRMVAQEKAMMFFILMLIILVAVFNLVCTLVMVVTEKEADIAILRTLGATPQMIMSIFIVQGAIVGIIGALMGVVGGVALALHVTSVVNGIQNLLHVQFLSSSVYFLDYLPSDLQWSDVWRVSSVALILSLLATLYPAWRASRTEPVEALRYE